MAENKGRKESMAESDVRIFNFTHELITGSKGQGERDLFFLASSAC
jgi:hypothetical protein